MQGLGITFLVRRARSTWLLLACVVVTVLLVTGLAAALWSFAAASIPFGARDLLASPSDRSIAFNGLDDSAQAVASSHLIRTTLHKAWPGVGFQMQSALWANPIQLPSPATSEVTIQPAALDGISAQAMLTAGTWPGPPQRGRPLPVALPAAVAGQLHLKPGSVLTGTPQNGGGSTTLQVTGVFRPRNPASTYWGLDLLPISGISVQGGSFSYAGVTTESPSTSYGPAVVNPAAFGGTLTASQTSWEVLPSDAGLAKGNIGAEAARTSQAVSYLSIAMPPYGLKVTTRLPQVLTGMAGTVVLARSLFAIGALQLLLIAAAGLVLAARLLASLREEESALLRARGATRWQVTRPGLAEALTLAALAGLGGVLAGSFLAGSGVLHVAGHRASGITSLAWLWALIVLVLCAAVLAWPALRAGTPDEARARRSRQARLAAIAWAGGDLAVLALAALSVWELRGYSAVAQSDGGTLGIDPTVAVAPALAVAGVAIIPLRTLPLLARLLDRATERWRRLAAAIVSWQIGRRPIRQAGPALLVVVATAISTLALAGYASWQRSAADQAAFAVGSDVQVNSAFSLPLGADGAITGAAGVTSATAASVAGLGNGAQFIGLNTSTADKTILLRPDLSSLPLSKLWRRVTPRPEAGLTLPGRPERLEVVAAVQAQAPTSPAALRRGLDQVFVNAWIQDAGGGTYEIAAGYLPADGQRHALIVPLSRSRQGDHPFRLLGLTMTYDLPPYDAADPQAILSASFTLAGLAVSPTSAGAFSTPVCGGAALTAWRGTAVSPDVPAVLGPFSPSVPADGTEPAIQNWTGGSSCTTGAGHQLKFTAGEAPSAAVMSKAGITPGANISNPLFVPGEAQLAIMARSLPVIPVIATDGYLAASRLQVGMTTSLSLGGFSVPVKIVASVADFPTVFTPSRALVADLPAVNDLLITNQASPLPVTRWWLRTRDGRVPRPPAGLSATSRVSQTHALLGNPLLSAPRQAMLAIGAAAVLLGVLGFSVNVAASLRARRTQSAVFAALGVGQRAQAGHLCLEQLALSVPAAAAGLLAGIGLARLMVPAITLNSDAAVPFPPVLTEIPLAAAAVLALATAVLPAVAAALTVVRRPDPAVQLRAEAR